MDTPPLGATTRRPNRPLRHHRIQLLEDRNNPAGIWDGGGGNFLWHTPANWDDDTVPSGIDVTIGPAFSGVDITISTEVSINSLTSSANIINTGTLTLADTSIIEGAYTNTGGGTLAGDGNVTIDGVLTWNSGTMTGTGHTIANAGMALDTVTGKFLLGGRTLTNHLTTTWTGGTLLSGDGAVFINAADGIVDLQFDGGFGGAGAGETAPVFENYGVFKKTAGTGNSNLTTFTFNNHQTVESNSGTITFANGGVNSGLMTGTAAIAFSSDYTHSAAGLGVTSAVVNLTGGTTTFNDTSSDIGELNVTPGTTLTGFGEIDADTLNWTGGTLTGNGILNVSQTLTMSGSAKTLRGGRRINHSGTGTWSAGSLSTGEGSIFHNTSAATWTWTHDGTVSTLPGLSTLRNDGTITKNGGTGTTVLSNFRVINDGALNVTTGGIRVGPTSVTVPAGTVTVSGGELLGGGTITGSLVNSGIVNPTESLNVTGNYTQTSGGLLVIDLYGTNPANVDRIIGEGTFTLAGTMSLQFFGYTPVAGDVLSVLSGADRVGTFSSINGLTFGATTLEAEYLASGLRIVVPGGSSNQPPVANDDPITVTEGAAFTFDVRTNDTDPESDALTVSEFTTPAVGSLVQNGDGSFTYTAPVGSAGSASFTYKVSDGTNISNEATVNITIEGPNTRPVATPVAPVTVRVGKDQLITLGGTDTDSDPVTARIVLRPRYGNLYQTSDGVTRGALITTNGAAVTDPAGRVLYEPVVSGVASIVNGDRFSFRVTDGEALSATEIVELPMLQNFHFDMTGRNGLLANSPGAPGYFAVSPRQNYQPFGYGWVNTATLQSYYDSGYANSQDPNLVPVLNDGVSAKTATFRTDYPSVAGNYRVTVLLGHRTLETQTTITVGGNAVLASTPLALENIVAPAGRYQAVTFSIFSQGGGLDLNFNGFGLKPFGVAGVSITQVEPSAPVTLAGPGAVTADPNSPAVVISGTSDLPAGTLLFVRSAHNDNATQEFGTINSQGTQTDIQGAEVRVGAGGAFQFSMSRPSGNGAPIFTFFTAEGTLVQRISDPMVLNFVSKTSHRFDFNATSGAQGTTVSPTAAGFIDTRGDYAPERGYGWSGGARTTFWSTTYSSAESLPLNDLLRDGVRGTNSTFNVEVPNGRYIVTPTFGSPAEAQSGRMSVVSGGTVVSGGFPDTDPKTTSKQFNAAAALVDVTSNFLRLQFQGTGTAPFALVGLTIEPYVPQITLTGPGAVLANPNEPVVIVTGETNLPPGTILNVKTDSGKIPALDLIPAFSGFQARVTADGRFTFPVARRSIGMTPTFEISSVSGTTYARISDPAVLQFELPRTRLLDFNATNFIGEVTSPTRSGYIGATGAYSADVGYGWIGTVPTTFHEPFFSVGNIGTGDLYKDGVIGRTPSTYRVDVPNGNYIVTPIIGHPKVATSSLVSVLSGGNLAGSAAVSNPAGEFHHFATKVTVTDGHFVVNVDDFGANPYAMVGLQVRPDNVHSLTLAGPGTVDADPTLGVLEFIGTTSLNPFTEVTVTIRGGGKIVGTDVNKFITGFQTYVELTPDTQFFFGVERATVSSVPTIEISDLNGEFLFRRQDANFLKFDAPRSRLIDFNLTAGGTSSPTALGGYLGSHGGYSADVGFGWVGTSPKTFNQSAYANPDFPALTHLYQDGVSDRTPGSYRVDVPNGNYVVTPIIGHPTLATSSLVSIVSGGTSAGGVAVSNSAGQFYHFATKVTVTDGHFFVNLDDFGNNPYALVGLQIRPDDIHTVTLSGPGTLLADPFASPYTINGTTTLPQGTVLNVAMHNSGGARITSTDGAGSVSSTQITVGAGGNFTFGVARGTGPGIPTFVISEMSGRVYAAFTDPAILNFVLPTRRMFDFDNPTMPNRSGPSETESGYLRSVNTAYSSDVGFGWIGKQPKTFYHRFYNTEIFPAYYALFQDGVSDRGTTTFRVDVPNGTYLVTPVLGHPTLMTRTLFKVDSPGYNGVTNIADNAATEYSYPTTEVTVTQGYLTLELSATTLPYSMVGLQVQPADGNQISLTGPGAVDADPTLGTVTLNGTTNLPADSYLNVAVSNGGTITSRDFSAAIQHTQVRVGAGGVFSVTLERPTNAANPFIYITETTGGRVLFRGHDPAILSFVTPATRRFDFNGNKTTLTGSETQNGYLSAMRLYDSQTGFGWIGTVPAKFYQPNFNSPDTSLDHLLQDGATGTTPATFVTTIKPGRALVTLHLGHPTKVAGAKIAVTGGQVLQEFGESADHRTAAGKFESVSYLVDVNQFLLRINIAPNGTTPYAMNGITITPVPSPGITITPVPSPGITWAGPGAVPAGPALRTLTLTTVLPVGTLLNVFKSDGLTVATVDNSTNFEGHQVIVGTGGVITLVVQASTPQIPLIRLAAIDGTAFAELQDPTILEFV